jgi:hypothetical protein
MLALVENTHPALKHGGYSATTILPGEDAAAFEKLHRDLIAELSPKGECSRKISLRKSHVRGLKSLPAASAPPQPAQQRPALPGPSKAA